MNIPGVQRYRDAHLKMPGGQVLIGPQQLQLQDT